MGKVESCHNKHDRVNDCVCDVVRAIADAQDNVVEQHCDVSCSQSIQNLVSPIRGNGLDTVPFILYNKKGQPFKGFGADIDGSSLSFDCFSSFIFRVNEVNEDCCATLELLTFENQDNACQSPCAQMDNERIQDLERTGICMTVDLSCFCAITCLPAVSLL